MNDWVGIYRGREGEMECSLCGDECENVSHVLWKCHRSAIYIAVVELVL